MTNTPALPAYMELSEAAAPMKFDGMVEEGVALVPSCVGGVTVLPDPVPMAAVGPAVVLLNAAYVEVTDATTWETVIVFVMVAVDVRVVVDEVSAIARRGRRRREVMVGICIVIFLIVSRECVFAKVRDDAMKRSDRIFR